MSTWHKTLVSLALVLGAQHGLCQHLNYVDPAVASCARAPAPNRADPKAVSRGLAVPGAIRVNCGLDQGSYTVTLNSTDPNATFAPKTFIVNFGRVVGTGAFTVTFFTIGVQDVSASITSNMGSPAATGHFAGPATRFNVGAGP